MPAYPVGGPTPSAPTQITVSHGTGEIAYTRSRGVGRGPTFLPVAKVRSEYWMPGAFGVIIEDGFGANWKRNCTSRLVMPPPALSVTSNF